MQRMGAPAVNAPSPVDQFTTVPGARPIIDRFSFSSITPPAINPYLAPAAQTHAVLAAATTTFTFIYNHFATISGRVRNRVTDAGIANVQVCDDLANCTTSTASGAYSLNIAAGHRILRPQRFVIGFAVIDPIDLGVLSSAANVVRDIGYSPNGTAGGHIRDQAGSAIAAAATLYFDYYDPATGGFLLESGYSGNKGTKLVTASYDLNQLDPQQLSLGRALQQQVPNPYAGRVGGSFGGANITRQQSLRHWHCQATSAR